MIDRAALTDQIAYLGDELAMFDVVLRRLPETLHRQRALEGQHSLREVLALLAARDAARTAALTAGHLDEDGTVEALAAADVAVPPGADDTPTGDLLARARGARTALGAAAAALDDASFAAAAPGLHAAVLADMGLLRALAEQLYDAQGVRGA